MHPFLTHGLVLVALLAQAVVSIASRGGGAIYMGHADSCTVHEHDADHGAADAAFRAGQRCETHAGPASVDGGVAHCCPCPHVHLEWREPPLVTNETRGGKISSPQHTRALANPGADPPRSMLMAQMRWRAVVRHLEADHPPPDGLTKVRLQI